MSVDPAAATMLDATRDVVVDVLGLEDRAALPAPESPLLGAVPELDSMAVLELVVALQEAFSLEIEDEDITAEMFATLGSLAAFVAARRS